MTWAVLIANRARRQLRKVSISDRDTVDFLLDEVQQDPFSGDFKFLKGTDRAIRRRSADWRILYDVDRERRLIKILSVERRVSQS